MRNAVGRNVNMCFPKIKFPVSAPSITEDHHSRPSPNSTTSNNNAAAAASSSILIKNFNSLYDLTCDSTSKSDDVSCCCSSSSSSSSAATADDSSTPDLAAIFASQRFFFSSPGRSNSIIDSSSPPSLSSSSSSTVAPHGSDAIVGGCGVAIPTFSPDPYTDFRRSMQEMVEARDLGDVRANWEHLHELLTCYLALNPKSTHKFIMGAFADLLVSLMASPRKSGGSRNSDFSSGGCSVSRRRL